MSDHKAARVERDSRGLRTTFEEIEVGADLGSLQWVVYPESVAGLVENDQDEHEWYLDRSPFGPPIVPPMATYPPVRILFARAFNVRGLFFMFESEFFRPILYGQEILVTGRVVDKWVKRDREYVAYEGEGHDADGALLFRTKRTHVLDYLPRTAPRAGEGVDSGIVAG